MAQISAHQRATLLSNAWFAGMEERIREDLVERAVRRQLSVEQSLFRRGDHYDGVYAVLEGSLRVSGTTREGREAILTFQHPGAWFGEIAAFDGLPRTHDLHAHSETLLLWLRPDVFAEMLHRHPALSLLFLRLECVRLRRMFAVLEEVSTQRTEQRLARHLLELAASFGNKLSAGISIELHLPQETLANLVGSTRQRVNQVLLDWERAGLLAQRRGRLRLTDVAVLRRLADG